MLVYLKLLDTPEEKEVFFWLKENYPELRRKIWFMRLSLL